MGHHERNLGQAHPLLVSTCFVCLRPSVAQVKEPVSATTTTKNVQGGGGRGVLSLALLALVPVASISLSNPVSCQLRSRWHVLMRGGTGDASSTSAGSSPHEQRQAHAGNMALRKGSSNFPDAVCSPWRKAMFSPPNSFGVRSRSQTLLSTAGQLWGQFTTTLEIPTGV